MAKTRVCHEVGMGLERLFARAFVVAGGLFWMAASFMGDYGYHRVSTLVSARNALLPLALTVVVFVLGLYSERATSALLGAGFLAILGWGVIGGWETGVWVLMGATLIAPIAISGVLYFLAADMQTVCSLASAPAAAPAETVA
jgi:hypothetical protein